MFTDGSTLPTHLVVYTDGGCLQDRGIGGWGVHGYFFVDTPSNQGTGNKKALPTRDGYVDGSGKPDITLTHYVEAFGSLPEKATNNIAELTAGLEALEIAERSNVTHLTVIADSKYFLQGLTEWMPNWIAKNWREDTNHPVANRGLWEKILAVYTLLKNQNVQMRFKWVKGHSNDFGNDIADRLSTLSLRAAINGKVAYKRTISDAKGFWRTDRTHSRLLNLPVWFYGVREDARDTTEDGRTVYYQGDVRDDISFSGKAISDASFSVVYLKEPNPVLETIRQESYLLAKASFYGLAVGYLPVILKPEIYALVEEYGTQFLAYDVSKNRLMSFQKEVLVEELRPVRRAYFAVDRLKMLETILVSYLQNTSDGFTFTDITDQLYEVEQRKKSSVVRLRPEITVTSKTLTPSVQCHPTKGAVRTAAVTLLYAQDLPDRNTLAAIADASTRVVVATWADSESVIRYATIVQTCDDVGIWAGPYSNLLILPNH